MGVRSLKDLDKIQERGSILLSATRARALVAGASGLVVLAFLVGLQVGRDLAPVEGKVVAQDVASADRTIEEILAAYRAEGYRPEAALADEVDPSPPEPQPESAEDALAAVEPVTDASDRAEPRIVLPPPIPHVPVLPEVVAEVIPAVVVADVSDQAEPVAVGPFDDLPAPAPTGGYAVQLAAFPTAAEAAALASDVEAAGVRAYTMLVDVRGETWHRVRVGRFSRRADAQAWLPVLEEMTPFEPIVVAE